MRMDTVLNPMISKLNSIINDESLPTKIIKYIIILKLQKLF